ncbi:MAG: hypothetical protein AMS16_05325 [Planctomycetes bacterium DG_58]|nr:MAG: hypothetical protein AMS16_05325 [Planctomycetes bacterium DG_58]
MRTPVLSVPLVAVVVMSGLLGCHIHKPRPYTELHSAARKGDEEEAVRLIAHGADVNAQAKHGETPLSFAAEAGKVEMAKLLIAKGADVNLGCPLSVAVARGDRRFAELLIANGAKPGGHAMVQAVCGQRTDMVKLLMAKGADVNARGATLSSGSADYTERAREAIGQTPLEMAAEQGYADMLQILLRNYALVNARDGDGYTALHHAARNGHITVVSILIENGADVNALARDSETPLRQARGRGHTDIVDFLREHGAEE